MSTQPGDRDMMFCHECHDEWYRDKHGFTCPECGSDFTELIDPSYPPKNGISDETSSQGQTPDILVSDEFRLLNSPLRGPKDSASLSKSRSPSQDINPTISQDHTAGRIHVEKQILTANNHTDSLGPGSLGRLTVEAMRKATRGQLTVNKTSPTNNQLPKLHRTLALSAPRNNSDSSPSVHPNQRQAQVSDSAISSGRPSGAETDISTSDSQSRRNHSGRGPDSTVVSDSVQPHAPIITNGVEKLLDNGQGIAYPPLHATAIGCDLHDCGFRTELENMRVMMDRLRQENIRLSTNLARSLQRSMPTRCVVLHQVSLGCSEKQSSIFSSTEMTYFDPPHWTKDVNGIWHVEAQNPVQEPQIFLERQKRSDVALILSLEYTVTANADSELQREFTQGPMIPESASAQLLCPVLKSAWSSLLDNDRLMKKYCRINRPEAPKYHDTGHKDYKIFDLNIFYYHFRLRIRKGAQMLTKPQQKQLDILLRSIDTSFGKQYEEAERLLGEGLVTSTIVPYLFVPNSVLICNHCQSVSGLRLESFIRREKFIGSPSYTAKTMCWGFDGKFYELTKPLTVQVGNDGEKPRTISSLDVFPLVYAPSEIKSRLRERGSKYWALRKAAYVTYKGWSMKQDIVYEEDTRFLIDVTTYHNLHGDETIHQGSGRNYLSDKAVSDIEPPQDDFEYLVPANIFGYDMQEKKWMDLQVDNISPIRWNKEIFETLSIDSQSKELILALVKNKIDAGKATDMVTNKGNGLIILLHGGPGTGKTLTAEGVAEIAKKPLYRVTCGDIGTEPQNVEQYLQKVFHLGKIWDCVVLLDEADVFLEQRSLADLSRNALVSVFLRTLEYYDGILILTSNRVGTFDEAFKSRIQVSLHYDKLDFHQRQQIWKNFINRLDMLDEDIDTEELLSNVANKKKLAKHEMNGRQIRNAITTARQLALFREETLGIKHLEQAIHVASKFEKYIEEVHDQIKDDEMARQDGIR